MRQFEASIEGVVLSQRLLSVCRGVLAVNLMIIWRLLLLSAIKNKSGIQFQYVRKCDRKRKTSISRRPQVIDLSGASTKSMPLLAARRCLVDDGTDVCDDGLR